ncbi:MAG: formylmethanofuran dehydrogenase subunit E family protein [Armatimonadota bacterium]|nr:formylmethanofuran dehydrogenase subunit E family protein [Armatimonadota bacterium]
MKEFTDLELAKSYHGHLGPYLVIGIKMGNKAIRELQPESCFRLQTHVYCPDSPPPSCVIDGLQLSTGCTMGKRNISHTETTQGVRVVVTNKDTGRSVELNLNEDFIRQAEQILKDAGEEEASMFCWNAADDEIFTTRCLTTC